MTEHKPAIPVRVRDVAYFVLLAGAAIALAAEGLAPIWADEVTAGKIADSAGVLVSVLALIGGGLGVAYRPGKTTPQEGAQSLAAGRHVAEGDR